MSAGAHGPTVDAEVAIVGGGPAGSATALFLLQRMPSLRGRVHLFEKHRHPREKLCGGAVSAWGMDHLQALGLCDRVQGIPITAFVLRMGNAHQRVERPGIATVVRRAVFDAMLFHAAQERGAVVHEGCGVTSAMRTAGGWRLGTSSGEVTARVLVGADGAAGGTRRMLGLGEPRRRAQLAVVETPGAEVRDRVGKGTLVFDLTPVTHGIQGYYWDFPSPLDGVAGTSRGIFHLRANGTVPDPTLRSVLDASLRARSVEPGAFVHRSWSIRPYAPGAVVSVPGAILTGEAVGVDPVTGEGIAHALEYGRLAADAIARALATGDHAFTRWTQQVGTSFVGRHLGQSVRLAPWVYGPRAALWARALVSSPSLTARGLEWYAGSRLGVTDALRYATVLAREQVRALAS